jgi:hypothetical protein
MLGPTHTTLEPGVAATYVYTNMSQSLHGKRGDPRGGGVVSTRKRDNTRWNSHTLAVTFTCDRRRAYGFVRAGRPTRQHTTSTISGYHWQYKGHPAGRLLHGFMNCLAVGILHLAGLRATSAGIARTQLLKDCIGGAAAINNAPDWRSQHRESHNIASLLPAMLIVHPPACPRITPPCFHVHAYATPSRRCCARLHSVSAATLHLHEPVLRCGSLACNGYRWHSG